MLGRMYERENCSAARALELIGERWNLLIIRNAVFGSTKRFSEWERRLGIAPNILAKRLDGLVSDGLMELRPADDLAGAHEYVLTQKGRELGLVVMALTEWGDRWAAPNGPPVRHEHDACGGMVHLSTRCEGCGQAPAVADIVAVPGPGAHPTGVGTAPEGETVSPKIKFLASCLTSGAGETPRLIIDEALG